MNINNFFVNFYCTISIATTTALPFPAFGWILAIYSKNARVFVYFIPKSLHIIRCPIAALYLR